MLNEIFFFGKYVGVLPFWGLYVSSVEYKAANKEEKKYRNVIDRFAGKEGPEAKQIWKD